MTFSWQTILAIGLGGFFGAIARAYSIHLANKYIPLEFPVGVLLVNVLGSFFIGILFAYFTHTSVEETTKVFLTTGFLGSLTTYSTFAIETYLLLSTSFYIAVLNAFFNLLGTIIAAGSGYKIMHYFIK